MRAGLTAFWNRFISAVAVWAALVFVLMFYHERIGIHSEWMPAIVFGTFVLVFAGNVLASLGFAVLKR